MRYASITALVLSLSLFWALPPKAAEPPAQEELAEKVRKAIDRAVKYLRDQEAGRGSFEKNLAAIRLVPGGMTSLATLAMLQAGLSPEDEMVQRCLVTVRKWEPDAGAQTYVVGLQIMVYALANQPDDKERIQRCVDWLVGARLKRGGKLTGWTYGKSVGGNAAADNSNTQYAILGLHEGFQAGAKVEPAIWEEIRDFYRNSMVKDGDGGGWGYRPPQSPTMTMTTAGLCGLLVADMNLKASQLQGPPKCDVPDCTADLDDAAIDNALKWVGRHMPGKAGEVPGLDHLYYCLYGIERTGRYSGQRFLGEKDWYRIGCEYLTGTKTVAGATPTQNADGSFTGVSADAVPIIGTSFALLFLAKGRTPVLISKMVHDPEDDWNRNRSDARNLTTFCGRELFKNVPLAWQVFDSRRAGDLDRLLDQRTAELLQSPVAYVSGKKAPRFKEGEEKLLRAYLDNGGFLMAEACCGSKDFDAGFRELINERIYNKPGDPKLTKLPASHPVYTASGKFAIDPNKYPLWGVESGCKTIVVYSPQGLSCWWENNYAKDGKGKDAFELGANIVAYATGLEAPRPRLTQMDVVKDESEKKVPRGFLKVAQVLHPGDPKPAPKAMPNLMTEMRKLGVDVAIQAAELGLTHESLPDHRFLYMHGRRDFDLSEAELKALRFHLETGGLLLADACCGSKQFDAGFRRTIKGLWPDRPLEAIPVRDELFGRELNGTAITEVKCRREGADGRPAGADFRTVAPALEGIKVNGRWAVIYSKYDIGCALEKHQSTDCLGHDHASAVLLAKAAVLYAMRR